MSNIKKMRVEATQGLEVILCDGIVGIQNVIGIKDGEKINAGNCVFLTRAEAKLLHEWLDDVIWADELWEQENC